MTGLPTAPADVVGLRGRAWRMNVDAIAARQRRLDGIGAELTVATWLVFAPYAHPVWTCYAILGVSLRQLEGAPAPHVHMPGATHEALVLALDPTLPIALDERPAMMLPPNFAGQFVALDDAAADRRIEWAVQEVVEGRLSPDEENFRQWCGIFSGSNYPRRGGR